jgi:hypothetical protein
LIDKKECCPLVNVFFSEDATNHTIFSSRVSGFDYSWAHVSVYSAFFNRKNKNADMWARMSFFYDEAEIVTEHTGRESSTVVLYHWVSDDCTI